MGKGYRSMGEHLLCLQRVPRFSPQHLEVQLGDNPAWNFAKLQLVTADKIELGWSMLWLDVKQIPVFTNVYIGGNALKNWCVFIRTFFFFFKKAQTDVENRAWEGKKWKTKGNKNWHIRPSLNISEHLQQTFSWESGLAWELGKSRKKQIKGEVLPAFY